MNTIEPVNLKELQETNFQSLITHRIRRILMICSNYDAFILEEDGQIESRIYEEYIELNLSNPPKFIWAQSSEKAYDIIRSDNDIDMIICMYNAGDSGVFSLASRLKEQGCGIPFVLLTHFSKEIYRRLMHQDMSVIDFVFSWHGNADLIVAIVKLFEDMLNAENDIQKVGVQAILLVEDSVRYYSTYLPELYRLILKQSAEFLKETLNEQQRKYRKRSRPKILLATNYDDAVRYYEKYKENLLGVISDIGFVIHKNDRPQDEKLDAGLDLAKMIKADDPTMPVLLQSSQESFADEAAHIGAGFLRKYSKTLIIQLADYIKEEFCFGDFIFRDQNRVEYGRAGNLKDLEKCLKDIPDDVLLYNTSRNMLSKWFYARGLFTLAGRFKKMQGSHFRNTDQLRQYVSQEIHDYHALTGRGIIAHFDKDSYEKYIWFARAGEGSLGGKARGLAFLNSLILKHKLNDKYPSIKVSIPRTMVIATDYFEEFILENGLQYVIDSEVSDDDILSEFVASRLPEALVDELRVFVSTVTSPLAVRSSSKLEDSNYQPFAGVYTTYMIPLTDNKDQMLRLLGKAIKSVYASVYFSGSRTYIQTTGNLLSEEKMGVIIQSICGTRHEGYYYPMLSGVARSVNYYPIGSEKKEDGIVNLAFGLGKTVVDGGHTLRFDPKYPKKILQLSDISLALRDTQKEMYVLDLRPGSFKTSRDDGINLIKLSVTDALKTFGYPELVASTFSSADRRIVPGVTAQGARIISFDAILKYGKFPLAKLLEELMEICKKELMCDIELEFAADVIPEFGGNAIVLKLLQVRPAGVYDEDADLSYEQVKEEIHEVLLTSDNALGSGSISGMEYILYVDPAGFDSSYTRQMATEISEMNGYVKDEGGNCLLIGPGRWGSSDPWLGIPVVWSDISEAKMIVECGIPGYQIEPSQGTHFFQNITSLGVGYLTINTVTGKGMIDTERISSMECIKESKFVKLFKAPSELAACIDRESSRAIVGL